MLAVIKTGGKQYIVSPGQKIRIEKLDEKEGKEIAFKEVLLVEKGNAIEIGTPFVKGAKVSAKILEQGRGKKVTILRFKSKTRHKRKQGHRQPFTMVEIDKIEI
jgi:large subunit ribosomal protein L21